MLRGRLLGVLTAAILLAACDPQSVNQGAVSDASGGNATTAPRPPGKDTPTWGKRYTWPDGLAVEVSAPQGCQPGPLSSPAAGKRVVKFDVVIINGSAEPFDTGLLTAGSDAQFAGKEAAALIDIDGPCGTGVESTTVLPGKTFTVAMSFEVDPGPGELQLTLQPGVSGDKAVYTGQA